MHNKQTDEFLKLPAESGCDDAESEYEKQLDRRWLVRETAMRLFLKEVRVFDGNGSSRVAAMNAWEKAGILWDAKPEDL